MLQCDYAVDPELGLRLVAGPRGIREIRFHAVEGGSPPEGLLAEAVRQLHAYFAGELRDFVLPLELEGTDFQLRVWNALRTIGYGETRSYAEIATAIGAPQAVRAVGAANGRNPVSIVVPCHRVIGANGRLTGYGGGLPLKKRLLDMEALYVLGAPASGISNSSISSSS